MTVQEWLGTDNQLGIDIWSKKYQFDNETFDEWIERVSCGDTAVATLIREKKFLFGGRILSNRGLDKRGVKTTLSNCYVIAPPEDNLESIFECATKLARTFSYGGGCGIDISKLAPKGAIVHNTAKTTSGAVSFMDLYSMITGLIGQNGRRGALMISMDVSHPDIEDFIGIKSDLNRVTKANISVRISDKFMEAVKADGDWELSFTREATGETITKTVKAKELFRKMCEMNWDYAEPGMLFWDRIKNHNLLVNTKEFEYAGTNPCLTGDTLITTAHGDIPIKDLVGKQPWVYCMDDNGNLTMKQASKVWKTRENAQLVLIETARGFIRCTPDHRIHTRNRGWVAASDLRKGDKITGLNRMMKDETHVSVALSGSKYVPEHRFVASNFYDISGKDVHHIDGDTLNNSIDNLEVLSHGEHSRVTNTGRQIEMVRDDKGRFVEKSIKAKRNSFNLSIGVGANWTVKGVTWLHDREDVYDMTVPEVHNFVANRMIVHNCAEEPLPAGGSCLLGALNLAEFVRDKQFHVDEFENAIRTAVVALNDVLDEGLGLHPLYEQRESVRDWRQIGLGVMGIADMLIKLEIPYGSKESIEVCDQIADMLACTAIDVSAQLAKKHGDFPKCNSSEILKTPFFEAHSDSDVEAMVSKYGLRNSQLLTIAPTGTLSTMLGISGGIEPIFANYYTRKTESLHNEDKYYKVYTPIVDRYMKEHGLTDESELPAWFVTAKDLDFRDRIEMQAAFQNHIDASISSTVNLPNDCTVEDVENLYMRAWERGLKGITIFRDGCKRTAVLSTDEPKKPKVDKAVKDDELIGYKRKLMTGCGSLHLCAYFDKAGNLKETFLAKGSTGGCNNFMIGLSRMISLAARSGATVPEIVDQLKSTGTCPSYAVRKATKGDTSKGSCCPVAIGNALMELWEEVKNGIDCTPIRTDDSNGNKSNDNPNICPECGSDLKHEMGCVTCTACGYSKCG